MVNEIVHPLGLTKFRDFAISCRHMRILKLLIENGASIDSKALDGATALTYAVNYRASGWTHSFTIACLSAG